MIDVDPRDPLKNPKWEKFARMIVTGRSADDAYVDAGFKRNPGNAGRLRNMPAVKNRTDYLLRVAAESATGSSSEAIKAAGLTREWVLERLMQIAEEGSGRALTKQRVRLKKKDESKKGGGIQFVEIETTVLDRPAAKAALELLGKEMALFEGAGAKDQSTEVDAARSVADPRVIDQINGVQAARLHLVANGGKKTA